MQKEPIFQKIGSTQKQIAKTTRIPAETDMAECISYKLRRYKIMEKNDGQLFWKSHSGFTGLQKGRCHIKGNILFLEPGKIERSGPIKREFMQHLARLPDWEKTKYFCPSYAIYYPKTGMICRKFAEDKDSKKGDAEDLVADSKRFGAGIKIESTISNKVITRDKLKTFFNFFKILVMLILKLLFGFFQIIYRVNRPLVGRWTGFRGWRFNCLNRCQSQSLLKLQEVPLNMENNQGIKVWDIAVRVFHLALVVCFTIAFISSEDSQKLHVFFGYSVLFLVLFRVLYGFAGTKHARFSDFLYPSAQIVGYLKGLLIGRPKHYIGHNPAGGFMVSILLLSLLSLTLTGLKAYGVKGHGFLASNEITFIKNAFADSNDKEKHDKHDSSKRHSLTDHRTEKSEKDEFWKEVHETIAYFTIFLLAIHIMGVLVSSLVHRENLIKAMITGRKRVM